MQRMRKQIQDKLPPSLKILMKRLIVGFVGSAIRIVGLFVKLGDRLFNIAVKNGLDINRVWNVKARPVAAPLQPWSSHDFLFIMNAISGRKNSAHSSDRPVRTSIIIPVFNKVEYTFQCLRSLMQEIDFSEHEVIVVNNASCDETEQVLSYLCDVVRVINNEENLGFVDACNQGAAVAKGKHLVFLNNDTVVLPGWLKHLLDTIDNDRSVGAVGSMLIYPDGLIQEAGAGIWKDGNGFHYGWRKHPEDRKYNFAREVDYCSGASLLVRKDIFDQLGGFDRRYAPAYYEDVDFCFGVRSLGHKVIYQPMSRLIHYEGITAGTDSQTGFKRFQEINREKFVGKWREVLERDHFDQNLALLETAANRRQGPRIVVFDDHVPNPDRDAGGARMFIILQTLVKFGQPVFVPLRQPLRPEYERMLGKEGIETASLVDYPKLIRKRKFSVAIFSRPDVAEALLPLVRKADRKIKIIFDTVDIVFLRLEREYKLTGDTRFAKEAMRYRKLESRLARASDQVWCVTPEDREVLAKEAPSARFEIIPTIHPLQARGKSFDERRGLLFIGGFLHRPNTDAVHYLTREIYPLIKKSIPGVKLYIVGSHAPPEIAAYSSEDIAVLGFVPDVNPIFHSSRVFVAPLRYGSGIKGKVGQALSYGLPVVTTTIGAEGMGLKNGHEAIIADDPQEFAEMVVEVYGNRELWQRLSDYGYTHIQKHFTPQVVEEKIYNAIKGLGEQIDRV